MRRAFIIACILFGLTIPRTGLAYLRQTDVIYDDKENVIYMIGWVFNRLTDAKTKSKEDSYRIYKIDLKDNIKTIYYETDQINMDRLIMSPDDSSIAVTRYASQMQTEILIIDKKLKNISYVIAVPEGIVSYVWSPDSKKIAYIAGTLGERELNAKGVWVYDLKKGNKKKIADSAQNIEWLPTGELTLHVEYSALVDGRKQMLDKTQIYDYRSDKIISDLKGINLSQDGRYSVGPRYIGMAELLEGEKIYVDFFDLKGAKTILATSLDKVFTERPRILWGPILWLKGNRIVVERFDPIDPKNPSKGTASNVRDISICDIEKNKVLKEFRGNIVGVNSDRSKLVIYHDGKFTAVDVP